MCDFLCVNNSNLPPILHLFEILVKFSVSNGGGSLSRWTVNLGLRNLASRNYTEYRCRMMWSVFRYLEPFRRDSLVWQRDGRTDLAVANGAFQYVARPIKHSRVFVELPYSTMEWDWSFSISAAAAAAVVAYVIIQVRRSFILHDASATPARPGRA